MSIDNDSNYTKNVYKHPWSPIQEKSIRCLLICPTDLKPHIGQGLIRTRHFRILNLKYSLNYAFSNNISVYKYIYIYICIYKSINQCVNLFFQCISSCAQIVAFSRYNICNRLEFRIFLETLHISSLLALIL